MRLGRGRAQSSIGTITIAGPRAGGGLVVGAHDRAGHVLGARGLVGPHRVVAREPVQAAGEERLEREVAAVLLADETTSGARLARAVASAATALPEPRRRVQQRERGRAAPSA